MAKYRKKPVVVDAVQWHQHGDHPAVERRWKCSNPNCQTFYAEYVNGCPRCSEGAPGPNWSTYAVAAIQTLEGWHEVSVGDYIIRGVKGELYPCKPDIFAATYEPATPAAPAASRQEGEDNWSMCQRLARQIDKCMLIQKLLLYIHKNRPRRNKGFPLWSLVGEATSHGSGVSGAICYVYGINPDTGEPLDPASESRG